MLPLLVALSLPALAPAETLQLRSGERLEARVLAYADGVFRLEGGASIPRAEVAALDLKAGAGVDPRPGPGELPAVPVLKEPEVEAWNREAAALEARFPGHAATLIRDEGVQELRADGTRLSTSRLVYRVNKDAAIGYGTWSEGFDPARERVRIVRARTVLADGTVIPLDPERARVQDARSSSSNLTNQKVMVWQLDGVRVGAYVEHVYETEVFQPFRADFFFPRFYFQSSVPVARTRFSVVVPEERTLHWVGSLLEEVGVAHEETRGEGKRVHTWTGREVAPMVAEPGMPGSSELTPRLAASLFDDWKTFFAWEAEHLERNIAPDASVEAKAREVVGAAASDEEKVARIYRFLQDEIRYVSVKSGIGSGWSGHPASETLRNGYGDCVDKAVLFSSLLRTQGLRADPVTIMTNDVRDMETRIPGLDANHCISQVHLGDRSFFLDSTTTNYRYPYFRDDDQGQPATNPLRGEVVWVPFPPPEDNEAVRVLRLELEADGTMVCQDEWSGTGSREAGQRGFWKGQKPRDYEKLLRDHYAALAPGAAIQDYQVGDPDDFGRPFGYTARFRTEGYGIRAGPLMIVKLPFLEVGFPEAALASRRYPIDYRATSSSRVRWEVTLPPGFRVKAHPADLSLETRSGRFELRSEVRGDLFVLERRQVISRPYVPAAEYPAHRAALERIQAVGREQLFLEEAP